MLEESYFTEKTKLTFDEFTKQFFSSKKSLKDISGLKQFFRLKPPVKGFERGGIKKPFILGGALGYRKEKINDFISLIYDLKQNLAKNTFYKFFEYFLDKT